MSLRDERPPVCGRPGREDLPMKDGAMECMREELLGGPGEGGGSEEVRRIIERHRRIQSRLIAILQDVQGVFGYLPRGELRFVSEELSVPLSRLYGIATFYKAFKLIPRGRHEIRLCAGTACHVRGTEKIKDAIERELGIEAGETTGDLRFSFDTVRCLGCCGLAPVMTVDEDVHGRLTSASIKKILENYE